MTAEQRLKEHLWSVNKSDYFHNAINKYGRDAFTVEVLATENTLGDARKTETFYILLLRTHDRNIGYNSTFGGEAGEIPTEETKKKIGLASSLRSHSEETRKKMSEAHKGKRNHFYGKKHSEETVAKIKEVCRLKSSGENNYWFGKQLSQEHKDKISKAKRKAKIEQTVSY